MAQFLFWGRPVTESQFRLLSVLGDIVPQAQAVCYTRLPKLAEKINRSVSQTRALLRELERAGWIVRLHGAEAREAGCWRRFASWAIGLVWRGFQRARRWLQEVFDWATGGRKTIAPRDGNHRAEADPLPLLSLVGETETTTNPPESSPCFARGGQPEPMDPEPERPVSSPIAPKGPQALPSVSRPETEKAPAPAPQAPRRASQDAPATQEDPRMATIRRRAAAKMEKAGIPERVAHAKAEVLARRYGVSWAWEFFLWWDGSFRHKLSRWGWFFGLAANVHVEGFAPPEARMSKPYTQGMPR